MGEGIRVGEAALCRLGGDGDPVLLLNILSISRPVVSSSGASVRPSIAVIC